MARIIVALGGNALAQAGEDGTWEEARRHMRATVLPLARLVAAGEELVLTHGNGPQVGNLLLQQEASKRQVPPLPLDVLGAMSQGWIGYLIQQEFPRALERMRASRAIVAWVTRTVVSPRDPAFRSPSKPVGPYYSENEARLLKKQKGWAMVEDAARGGWRRLVASPVPIEVLEAPSLLRFLEEGQGAYAIPVIAGGGGVPVFRRAGGEYEGVEAVIDKDRTAALLGTEIKADTLAIVTDVSAAAIAFRTPREKRLGRVGADEMAGYLAAGEFGKGSMGPKVEAALAFLKGGGRRAIITDSPSLGSALEGKAGTIVESAPPQRGARAR